MEISKDIRYVGVDDHDIDLFEGQYVVPNGMAYNSYVVLGSAKTAVMDTVDGRFFEPWAANVKAALDGVRTAKPTGMLARGSWASVPSEKRRQSSNWSVWGTPVRIAR